MKDLFFITVSILLFTSSQEVSCFFNVNILQCKYLNNLLAMKSNNHLMLDHIMEWFFKSIGGIQQSESSVAYKELVIKPEIVGDITYAKTTFNSQYGKVITIWEIEGKEFKFHLKITANSNALVYLPVNGEVEMVGKDSENLNRKVKYIGIKNEATA